MVDYQRISLQNSFILHRRSYRESSLLLDVFSLDYGMVPLIGKGIRRKRGNFSALLQPFKLLQLSWSGKSELQTLTGAEMILPDIRLSGKGLYCGFYINELLKRFLHRHDPHPDLFSFYTATLLSLSDNRVIEESLRFFELALLEEVGLGLQMDQALDTGRAIESGKQYQYITGEGPVEAKTTHDAIGGATLIGLRRRQLETGDALAEAKRLMRKVINYHLNGESLLSRKLFTDKHRF